MNCQMIRVISSPSSSTTGPATLIFATDSTPSTVDVWWARAFGAPGPHPIQVVVAHRGRGAPAVARVARTTRTGPRRCGGAPSGSHRSEVDDVSGLGLDGVGRLLQSRQLGRGQLTLDDLLHARGADLGLHA